MQVFAHLQLRRNPRQKPRQTTQLRIRHRPQRSIRHGARLVVVGPPRHLWTLQQTRLKMDKNQLLAQLDANRARGKDGTTRKERARAGVATPRIPLMATTTGRKDQKSMIQKTQRNELARAKDMEKDTGKDTPRGKDQTERKEKDTEKGSLHPTSFVPFLQWHASQILLLPVLSLRRR